MNRIFVVVALAGCFGVVLGAQPRAVDSRAPAAQVYIDSIELSDAASDRVQLNLDLHAATDRNLRIRRITFEDMRLAGVPVYLGVLQGPLEMKANAMQAMPPIPLTVYFRDLDSLSPLIRAVSDGQITVDGYARVEFDLNLFQKFALRQWSGRSDVPVHDGVPFEVPGGEIGRIATATALRATDVALHLASSALGLLRRSQADWTQTLGREYAPALILAEARYSLIANDGRSLNLIRNGVGFRIPNGKFVLTAELLSPWKYDPEVASMLQTNQAKLAPERFELVVWPGNIPINFESGLSLSRGDFRVLRGEDPEEVNTEIPLDNGGYGRVRVGRRDSPRNLAEFQFSNQGGTPRALPIGSNDEMRNEVWERVAIVRFSERARPEIVFTPAHRDRNRILLDNPIDASAFGSPVLTPRGAIAMLQDEHSAITLNRLF